MDFQPADGLNPAQVAVDETVIQIDSEQFRLYPAVDPASNRLLHVRRFPTRTTVLTQLFLRELAEKHDVEDAEFLVDRGPGSTPPSIASASISPGNTRRQQQRRTCLQRVKRRTKQFRNMFSHVNPDTAESWLQAFAVCHNARN